MIVPKKAIAVLLVENNTADVDLTREVLAENNDHLQLNAVRDGERHPYFCTEGEVLATAKNGCRQKAVAHPIWPHTRRCCTIM